MSFISDSDDGVMLRCGVCPSASKNAVSGLYGEALKITLAAPPVDGKANKELRAFLARKLGISKSKVVVVAGGKSRNKTVSCVGVSREKASALLPVSSD